MKKIFTIIFASILFLNSNLFTENNPAPLEKESRSIETLEQSSSHFFRNLIIGCILFASGYIASNVQNFDYTKINNRGQVTKISMFIAYLYKLGIKELERDEAIFKTPCSLVDVIISNTTNL